MSDEDEKRLPPTFRWFQVSLRTLLAVILGFGLGLAVGRQFRADESGLPNPSNIRRGDSGRVQWRRSTVNWSNPTQTAKVLADGTIRLRELGSVPAAGFSLDELTEDLKTRYETYYAKTYGNVASNALGGVGSPGGGGPGGGGPPGAGPAGVRPSPAMKLNRTPGEIEVFVDFGTTSAKE